MFCNLLAVLLSHLVSILQKPFFPRPEAMILLIVSNIIKCLSDIKCQMCGKLNRLYERTYAPTYKEFQSIWDLRFSRRCVLRWMSFRMSRHLVKYKLTDVSEIFIVSVISLMVKSIIISETSVNFYLTKWRSVLNHIQSSSISVLPIIKQKTRIKRRFLSCKKWYLNHSIFQIFILK